MLFAAIEIEINSLCNRRCSYCPNSMFERKAKGEIDPKIFDKLMGELRDMEFRGRVSYDFYNEPMLHSNFEEIVARTRAFLPDAAIDVYTNGTVLSLERFVNLLRQGVSQFIVTRHENETSDVFEATYKALSHEQKQNVEYRMFSEITLTNRGGLLKHLGPDGLALAPCYIPSCIVTVTVEGNVLPCFEDFNEKLVMGNLSDQRLIDIWNSEKYVHFRDYLRKGQRHLFEPCKGCNRRQSLPPVV